VSGTTVLILGGEDEHALHVLDALRQRGADAERLDSRWFPSQMTLAFDPVRGEGRVRLPGGRKLDFAQVSSVYWRRYEGIGSVELPDPEQSFIAANDARSLFESLLVRLPARWVNGWNAYLQHQTKPVQLAIVAALGIEIPVTLLANDSEAVREFADRHPSCIFKPVQGGAHTRRLTAAHLSEENLQNLAVAPVTVQQEVAGTNIRVFVAGRRVMSCEIQTPAIDFRDHPDAQVVPHDLPAAVEATSLKIAEALDMLWTGIDFRLAADGRYVFLEANPSPMFLGFESRTGLPLTDSLVDLLLGE
jgi:glutathione synthase/RimK-type ligase-like ATP-grasp enzyme